jgi:hypothetical protein
VCNQRLGAFCTDPCEILALQLSQVKARAGATISKVNFMIGATDVVAAAAIAQTSAKDIVGKSAPAASYFRVICAIDVTRQRE